MKFGKNVDVFKSPTDMAKTVLTRFDEMKNKRVVGGDQFRGRHISETNNDFLWMRRNPKKAIQDISSFDKEISEIFAKEYGKVPDMWKNVPPKRKRKVRSVKGYRPNIPNAIMGLPKTMYENRYQYKECEPVNVYMSAVVSAALDHNQCIGVGAWCYAMINYVNRYRPVRLWLYSSNTPHYRCAPSEQDANKLLVSVDISTGKDEFAKLFSPIFRRGMVFSWHAFKDNGFSGKWPSYGIRNCRGNMEKSQALFEKAFGLKIGKDDLYLPGADIRDLKEGPMEEWFQKLVPNCVNTAKNI